MNYNGFIGCIIKNSIVARSVIECIIACIIKNSIAARVVIVCIIALM